MSLPPSARGPLYLHGRQDTAGGCIGRDVITTAVTITEHRVDSMHLHHNTLAAQLNIASFPGCPRRGGKDDLGTTVPSPPKLWGSYKTPYTSVICIQT